jgi:cytochrome P450
MSRSLTIYPTRFLITLTSLTPVAITMRQADNDDIINGVKIPKGTPVFLAPGICNFDQRTWGEDAEQFNPDRWNSLPETISNYSFLTFLQGISNTNTINGRHPKLHRS